MYLPSTFIYHNHKQLEKLPDDRGIRPFIHSCAAQMSDGRRSPKGYIVNQYTYGVALMEAPAFLAAHAFELARGSYANGFSGSYRAAISLITILYGIAGLVLVYWFLRRRFEPGIASITTALLLVGTNLFWFVLHQQGMSHVPLFFLFAALLHFTDRIYRSDSNWRSFAGLGFTAGLITLIRPVDGLCVLIPLLFGIGAMPLRSKLAFLWERRLMVLLAVACFVLVLVPQLLYWKWLTGSFIYDTYGPGQTMDLWHPHFRRGFLGASNGWLFYSPLMVLALAGLLWWRRMAGYRIAIPVFLFLYSWCIYSWFAPYYPNGLGSRPMVDVYAVWAVPLAVLIERATRSRRWVQMGIITSVLFFTAINISYAIQAATGIIWSENSNYAYNLGTAFRYRNTYNDLVVWDTGVPQPDTASLIPVGPIALSTVKDSAISSRVIQDTEKGKVLRMEEEYSPLLAMVSGAQLAGSGAKWICCSGRFKTLAPVGAIYSNQMMVVEVKRQESGIAWYGVRINNKIGLPEHPEIKPEIFTFRDSLWGNVRAFVPVPENLQSSDVVRFFVWNIAKKPLLIDELKLSFYR
jgi:hypothetical protein